MKRVEFCRVFFKIYYNVKRYEKGRRLEGKGRIVKDFDLFNPTEDHQALRTMVRDFAKKEIEPFALEHNRREYFNLEAFHKLGELGLLGITVPEKYGGSQMDSVASVIACEELSYSDPGFCLSYLAHAILCVNNLAVNGNEVQKKDKLPRLCSGEWVGAMAMSEPHVGTDVFNMTTKAQKKGGFYIIHGQKMWITNGVINEENQVADCVLLYALSSEGKSSSERSSISTFLVEKGHKGYRAGQKIKDKAGMRSSYTAELIFDHCEVPVSALIGKDGESALHMMRNLEIERLTLAAMSLGIAKRCLQVMNQYANEREAFNHPLSYFGQVQKHIAGSFAEYMASRSYVYNTARSLDFNQFGHRVHSDGVKLVASKMGKNVADRAIQVLGGYGYVGEYVVERLWRDAKLLEIGGGTIEALERNITSDLKKSPEFLR